MNIPEENIHALQYTDFGFGIRTESQKPLTPEQREVLVELAKEHLPMYLRQRGDVYSVEYNQTEIANLLQDKSIYKIQLWVDQSTICITPQLADNQGEVLRYLEKKNGNSVEEGSQEC